MKYIIVFILGFFFPILAQAADSAWIECGQEGLADAGYSVSLKKSGDLFDYRFSANSYSGPRILSSQKVSLSVSGSGSACKVTVTSTKTYKQMFSIDFAQGRQGAKISSADKSAIPKLTCDIQPELYSQLCASQPSAATGSVRADGPPDSSAAR